MMRQIALSSVLAVAAVMSAPASAAELPRTIDHSEQRQAAFAGAAVRLEFGGRTAAAPEARLGIGFSRYQRGGPGAFTSRTGPQLPLEIGLFEGRPTFFVGGERASRMNQRLGFGNSTTPLLLVGGLAVGVLAVVLISGDDDDANTCPPGVEVCAF